MKTTFTQQGGAAPGDEETLSVTNSMIFISLGRYVNWTKNTIPHLTSKSKQKNPGIELNFSSHMSSEKQGQGTL